VQTNNAFTPEQDAALNCALAYLRTDGVTEAAAYTLLMELVITAFIVIIDAATGPERRVLARDVNRRLSQTNARHYQLKALL
jgi:hypothetical protein